MTREQRLTREQDPRVRHRAVVTLACALLIVLGALAVAGLRIHQVRLAYRLDALRAERTRIETLIRQLEVEVATLRAPARLEHRARELGMTLPARSQVRLAREYVPGGTAAAAAGTARIEALVR